MKHPNVNDQCIWLGAYTFDCTDGGVLCVARVILAGDDKGPSIRATVVRGVNESIYGFRQRITDTVREIKGHRSYDHTVSVFLGSHNVHNAAEHLMADARWNANQLTWHLIERERNPDRRVARLCRYADRVFAA